MADNLTAKIFGGGRNVSTTAGPLLYAPSIDYEDELIDEIAELKEEIRRLKRANASLREKVKELKGDTKWYGTPHRKCK